MRRLEYDRLVRNRKKFRLGGSCDSENRVAQGAPAPPVASDPEESVF